MRRSNYAAWTSTMFLKTGLK